MAAPQDIPFACSCGTVQGVLVTMTPAGGTRADCSCNSCREAPLWLGQPSPIPARYFQTTPDRVRFTAGADHLAAFTWSQKTLLRWYATCCNTPLFNTAASPKVPFASLYVDSAADPAALGPVVAHAFIDKGNGKQGHKGLGTFVWRMAKRAIPARLSGRWRNTPFFDPDTSTPKGPVTHLTHEDRQAARQRR